MENIITFTKIHDGYTFYFTKEAFESDKEIIGFYFDRLGFPQTIHRNSLFGGFIKTWLSDNN